MKEPVIVFLDADTLPASIRLRRPAVAHRWIDYPQTAPADIAPRLAGATIAITNKVPLRRADLARLPDLRMVAVAATGVDRIDVEFCRARGIEVANAGDYARDAVAEHALMLMLALRRNLPGFGADVARGLWEQSPHFSLFSRPINDLCGARLMLFGSGSIGRRVAELAAAFGMEARFVERKGAATVRAGFAPFDEALAEGDLLSLHCPYVPASDALIGAPELRRMKRSALLINTARGALIDESALATALREGRIAGAGVDVAATEPLTPESPLKGLIGRADFILTPHVAWASDAAMRRLAKRVGDNIDRFIARPPLRGGG